MPSIYTLLVRLSTLSGFLAFWDELALAPEGCICVVTRLGVHLYACAACLASTPFWSASRLLAIFWRFGTSSLWPQKGASALLLGSEYTCRLAQHA